MRLSALLAAAALCLVPLAAQAGSPGIAQAFANKAGKLAQQIASSKVAVKDQYMQKLTKLLTKAGCSFDSGAMAKEARIDCAKASDSALSDASDDLDSLSDDWSSAAKQDGSKSLADLYAPQIAALKAKIDNAPIDKEDKEALDGRLDDLKASLSRPSGAAVKRPGKSGAGDADIDDKLQEISDDLASTLQLAKDADAKEGVTKAFLSRAQALQSQVSSSKLNKSLQSELTLEITELTDVAQCKKGTRKAALRTENPNPRMPHKKKKDCDVDADTIADLQSQLADIQADFTQLTKVDAGQSMAQIYAPKVKLLQQQLAAAKNLDSKDMKNLNAEISNFVDETNHPGVEKPKLRNARIQRFMDAGNGWSDWASSVGGRKIGGKKTYSSDELAADFQKVSDDVNAALQLADGSGSKPLTDQFIAAWNAAKSAVGTSKLAQALQNDLQAELSGILSDAGCSQKGDKTSCAKDTGDSTLAAGQAALKKLDAELAGDVSTYGSKSLESIFSAQLQQLGDSLSKSKVSQSDAKPLQLRLQNLTRTIQHAGPRDSFSKLQDKVKSLSDDINGAIKLTQQGL